MWEAGSIQCNYISPQPVFLAILPGSLFWKDGNIGRRAVQWVKYRQELMCHLGAHMRSHTRPAGRLTCLGRLWHPCGVAFFQCSTHTNTFQKKVPAQLFVPITQCEGCFRHSFHICVADHCSMVCFYGHLWSTAFSTSAYRLVYSLYRPQQKTSELTLFSMVAYHKIKFTVE